MRRTLFLLVAVGALVFILRQCGLVECSAAKYNQLFLKSNVFRHITADSIEYAFSLSENSSQGWYEDGWITIQPDYDRRLMEFVDEATPHKMTIHFADGDSLHIPGDDFEVLIQIDSLQVAGSMHMPIVKHLDVAASGALWIRSMDPERDGHYKRTFAHESQLQIMGLSSSAFTEVKVHEIWLSHVIRTIHNHIEALRQ